MVSGVRFSDGSPTNSLAGILARLFVIYGGKEGTFMTIRKANVEDVKGIMSLLYQVAEVHHKGRPDIFKGGCSKYTEEELTEIIKAPDTPVYVAEDENGAICGHAFCVFKEGGDNHVLVNNKTLYIDDICVDENCRGKHVGTALCNTVIAMAKESGCYNVTLNVWCLNEGAMEFYKAMGFVPQRITMEKFV